MTEKKRESRYRQTEGTLNEEVRSLRAKLARIEHAKGQHEEWTDIHLALVDNSAQGLAVIENGRIVFANRNMETLTGYSVEKLRAMSAEQVRTLVHPEDQQAVWTRHRDRLSGQDLVLQRNKGSSKLRRPADDPMGTTFLLGGHRYGRQYDYEAQAGIDAFPQTIRSPLRPGQQPTLSRPVRRGAVERSAA